MQKIKNENGVTMLMLVITIIILAIVSAIVVQYTIDGMGYSEEKKALADLEVVQHAVIERYEQYKLTEDTSFIIGVPATEADLSQLKDNNWEISHPSNNIDAYYKLTTKDLDAIGIKNAKDEYIVNYKTGECYNMTKKRTSENDHELYIK